MPTSSCYIGNLAISFRVLAFALKGAQNVNLFMHALHENYASFVNFTSAYY